jgi:hypothetical protein
LAQPGAGLDPSYFSVRWTGQFYAPKTGIYQFSFVADDGVRLWVDDKLLINEWRLNRPTSFSGQIALEGKKLYRLKVEYSQMKPSYAAAQASWSFAGGPTQLLTAKNVFSTPPKPPVAAVKKPASKPARKTPPKAAVAKALAKGMELPPQKAALLTMGGKKDTLTRPAVPVEPVAAGNKAEPATSPPPPAPGPVYFEQSRPELRPECCAVWTNWPARCVNTPGCASHHGAHRQAGDFFINVQLSRDRAKAVADYLLGKGVPGERIAWRGLGGVYPVAPNTRRQQAEKPPRRVYPGVGAAPAVAAPERLPTLPPHPFLTMTIS